ncbi:NAD(P)-dependent dehydrogenase, short-chain alcohol dehydrogenase family [Nonomuraea solani]|uniref:NAD(P)-dependent dehydrogenase, short-chain alcohol dehydrogenase family n=1 Tax=Nonomuraea solani TaxID=1144553 RepID=A0A1H6ES94_9ACTN|nr:SDR family oxidoreductase [Nonomuraea solani]SEH00253.1 NAD(P)-dependent dehydrogenase, short-chain alcohol dehydrogenase family [Nonomuraea solani]
MMDHDVAIVTGGGGDIGRGVCRALSKAGTTVVTLDLDISHADGADRAIQCDVRDPAACAGAVEEVVRDFGRVDTLVNLAQAFVQKPLPELTDEDMRLVFDSGPMATLRMMQLCYRHLKRRGGGSIINFASAAGTQGGIPGLGAYAAAKEAIRGLSKHAAVEWGPDNIRTNVICPAATSDPNRFGFGKQVADRNPLRRIGDPEADIGGVVVFLAGPSSSYINGRTLHVDGGAGTFR